MGQVNQPGMGFPGAQGTQANPFPIPRSQPSNQRLAQQPFMAPQPQPVVPAGAVPGSTNQNTPVMPQKPGTQGPVGNVPRGTTAAPVIGARTFLQPQITGPVPTPTNPAGTNTPAATPGIGAPLPGQYLTPRGPVETGLAANYGPGGFLGQVAQGQIPTAQMQQYRNLQKDLQAQLASQMGGARFGSDYARSFGDASGQALTNLMVQTQQNALGAQQGANPILGSEVDRNNNAMRLMWQDFAQQSGLPPEIGALISLMTGLPGGTMAGSQQKY